MKCEYGCGDEAQYTLSNGKQCCSTSFQSCPALRQKNSIGLRIAHQNGKMRKFTVADIAKSNEVAKETAIMKCFQKDSDYASGYVKNWLYNDFEYLHKCLKVWFN